MTALEQAVRVAWIGWADDAQWTTCWFCKQWRYCRRKASSRWCCLDCFDQR